MQTIPVIIIGGGLSGLYAAYLLEQRGIDYLLLEARARLGGRILSSKQMLSKQSDNIEVHFDAADKQNSFDMGPSWFWPEYQPQLAQLIEKLQLESFAQFETGDMMMERTASEPAVQTRGYKTSPASMRLKGGMIALIEALYSRLDPSRIIRDQSVYKLTKTERYIEIDSQSLSGVSNHCRAQQVLLALPPRLVVESITFEPKLPTDLSTQWQDTATWMAPHAKYFAVYNQPFWREQGLSGAARSSQGPMVEMHDASPSEGNGALFGFIGVPATSRQSVSAAVLKAHCRAQLVRLFGEQAATPTAEYLKDWAQDKLTATAIDSSGDGQHPLTPLSKAHSGVWHHGLTGIGSEWSPHFSGYLAGAIEAAGLGVESLPKLK